ncbi:Uncharacterised protein [Kingella potus]|uniref:Uncharacterized protein n=1 Tax=Kingella potus TaxID=265175 RepID=A0A377R4W1_9NEIS|nr:hypothetical protein [Kingella potus]UOP00081.1 hypothetical protein LVJ84_08840 [Kingella potus]STR03373.1 Uncharacterised protein [Kingella potus]
MMSAEIYKNFLNDVINEISNKYQNNTFEEDSDLQKGYDFAIYEVMSLLVEQSEAFGLNKEELGLGHLDAEKAYLF